MDMASVKYIYMLQLQDKWKIRANNAVLVLLDFIRIKEI